MIPETLPNFPHFGHFVNGQMFLCNVGTQQECLDGCLFGSPRNKWSEILKITKNTAIFLWTTGKQPTLHGLFIAVSQPFLDMDTSAFGARFPCQVRVKLFYKFPPIPGDNVTKMFKGDRNMQRHLTRRQTHEIIASAVSYMYNQRDAGILERLLKQRKESPAGLPVQRPIVSLGTTIYAYNPKNTNVSFAKRPIPFFSNANDGSLSQFSSLAFQPLSMVEYWRTPNFPLCKTQLKSSVVSRGSERKVGKAASLQQQLYFAVLPQTTQSPLKKLLPKKNTAHVTKLFVGNLHSSITNDCLRSSFSNFGRILESGIQKNAAGYSMGSGWVEFENPTEAARVIERVNSMHIAGLTVVVFPWSGRLI